MFQNLCLVILENLATCLHLYRDSLQAQHVQFAWLNECPLICIFQLSRDLHSQVYVMRGKTSEGRKVFQLLHLMLWTSPHAQSFQKYQQDLDLYTVQHTRCQYHHHARHIHVDRGHHHQCAIFQNELLHNQHHEEVLQLLFLNPEYFFRSPVESFDSHHQLSWTLLPLSSAIERGFFQFAGLPS